MEWITIIALVVFGLVLIIVEVIFVPGTTFVGIVGFGVAGFGVWQSFISFGTETGLIVLTVSSLLAVGAIFYSFKAGVWKRFALNDRNKAQNNDGIKHSLQEGEMGITLSALRPIGKAEFSEKVFEVKTNGNYVDTGTKIKIVKILDQSIIVDPISA